MGILSFLFEKKKPTSASVAKERLQIIIAREHSEKSNSPDFLPALKEELLAVISKYIKVDTDAIKVSLDRKNNLEVLDVNVVINDSTPPEAKAEEKPEATEQSTSTVAMSPAAEPSAQEKAA